MGGLHVRYVLPEVPRGRYRFDAVRAVFEDPFGLAHAEQDLGAESTLLVYPRLVELERVFSELGVTLAGGHVVLRRTAGFDLHTSASTRKASRCARCTGGRLRNGAS